MQNNRWNEIGNTCSKLNFFNKTKMTELEQRNGMDKHTHKSAEQLLTRNGSVMQISNLDLDPKLFFRLEPLDSLCWFRIFHNSSKT